MSLKEIRFNYIINLYNILNISHRQKNFHRFKSTNPNNYWSRYCYMWILDFRSCYYKQCFRIGWQIHYVIMLRNTGIRIIYICLLTMSNTINQHYLHYNSAKTSPKWYHIIVARSFMKEMYRWSDTNIPSLWWHSQAKAIGRLSPFDRVCIQKFIHNQWPIIIYILIFKKPYLSSICIPCLI